MRLTVKDIAVFGMLTAAMLVSKKAMEVLPNIHLLAAFVVAITVVYRQKALYPLYAYVLLDGMMAGFATWWMPYLYLWTVLWGVTMLLPRTIPPRVAPIVYMMLCAAHGLCFGILYAPMQAWMFGLNAEQMLAWIVAGLPFDAIHGVSNFFCGALVVPLVAVLRRTQHIAQ